MAKSETASFDNHWGCNKFWVRLGCKWYLIKLLSKSYDYVLKSFLASINMTNAINEAHPSRLKVSFSFKNKPPVKQILEWKLV